MKNATKKFYFDILFLTGQAYIDEEYCCVPTLAFDQQFKVPFICSYLTTFIFR